MISCGKIRYASRGEAKAYDRELRARHGQAKQRCYCCPRCGTWHLTRNSKSGSLKGGSRKGAR